MKLDVTNRKQITEVTSEAKQKFGFCDIVINNAGIMQVGHLENMDEKVAKLVMDVNCMSNMWIAKEFLSDMIQRDEG